MRQLRGALTINIYEGNINNEKSEKDNVCNFNQQLYL
jgi:hypothetical protein